MHWIFLVSKFLCTTIKLQIGEQSLNAKPKCELSPLFKPVISYNQTCHRLYGELAIYWLELSSSVQGLGFSGEPFINCVRPRDNLIPDKL